MWRRGNWRRGLGQRFGFYGAALRDALAGQRVVWFHAVSVGEVNLCAMLVRALGDRLKGFRVVVSTTTTTGMGELERQLPEDIHKVYYPIDFSFSVRRALQVIHPELVVLVEAEIWPNFLWRLGAQGVPVFLANARLSSRSGRRYQQFSWLFRSLFARFSGVGVQNERDADLLAAVGCLEDRIQVTGNLKFDAVPPPSEQQLDPAAMMTWAGAGEEPLVLLGSSTHAGEEVILGEIYLRLRRQFPQLFLVVVPRHFERGADVSRELESLGIRCCRRSTFDSSAGATEDSAPSCLLVDSTGELRFFFDVASVVFIGKSLTAHGGQNPIEPAAAGRAVVMGPNMENFRAVTRTFLAAESVLQVSDTAGLEKTIGQLLANPKRRAELGEKARDVVVANRGAVQRTVEMITPVLEAR